MDSLVARLREERVRRVIEPILVGAAHFDPTFNDDFLYVSHLGLVTRKRGKLEIANPIYQEIIPRVLSFQVPDGLEQVSWYAKRLGIGTGYLVIFDRDSGVPFEDRGEVEEVQQAGVTVVVVRI